MARLCSAIAIVFHRTVADGSLLLASRVDPVFMLLPLLSCDASHHYSPLSQYLTRAAGDAAVLRELRGLHAALAAVCDVHGDAEAAAAAPVDERFYRLSRAKTLAYLSGKARRLAGVLQRQCDEGQARTRAQFAAFSTRSAADAAAGGAGAASPGAASAAAATAATAAPLNPAVSSSMPLVVALSTSAGILSEYLAPEWSAALAVELG